MAVSRKSAAELLRCLRSLGQGRYLSHATPTLSSSASTGALGHGFVELREYDLKPEGMKRFMSVTQEHVELRKQLLPFMGMFTCDTGGALNRVTHFYHYQDHSHRDACRRGAAQSAAWQEDYLTASRLCVSSQASSIYMPTTAVLEAAQALPLRFLHRPDAATPGLYELRRYQLHAGYDVVPKLAAAFAEGIPHKLAAYPRERAELVFFGHTDVGVLNNVIELWRYESTAGCMEARQASRHVPQWREAIAGIAPLVQTFQSSFLQPAAFSPMQ